MKKYIKLLIAVSGLTILAATSSCGDKLDLKPWEFINQGGDDEGGSSSGPSLGDTDLGTLEGELKAGLQYMLEFEVHAYQYNHANDLAVFAGYFTVSHSAFGFAGPLPNTYYYPNDYYDGPYGSAKKLWAQIYHAYNYAESKGKPEWKALAIIAYAYTMQALSDIYGAVPYDDGLNLKQAPPLNYIGTQEAYSRILADLENAIAILKDRQPVAEELKKIEGEEGGYSDLDWKKWVKFANSIRLRMAMHMAKTDIAQAQSLAEAVVSDEIGVLDTNFQLTMNGNPQHPLYMICNTWNDLVLGASLESIMKTYQSPLIEKWFAKNGADIKAKTGALMMKAYTDYVGLRQGTAVEASAGANSYGAYSKFSAQYMPRTFFKVAEIYFLKAEGTLRGWNMGGTMEEFYKKGIQQVFSENNVSMSADEYIGITDADIDPSDYTDYYQSENSIEARVKIGVELEDGEDNDAKERNLERIITQKYIANFPMAAESWTDFRRTGYPRLYPCTDNAKWPDGSFDNELQIRRLPYSNSGTPTDEANNANVETALGGKNTAGFRLWWDVATESRDENNRVIPKNF